MDVPTIDVKVPTIDVDVSTIEEARPDELRSNKRPTIEQSLTAPVANAIPTLLGGVITGIGTRNAQNCASIEDSAGPARGLEDQFPPCGRHHHDRDPRWMIVEPTWTKRCHLVVESDAW